MFSVLRNKIARMRSKSGFLRGDMVNIVYRNHDGRAVSTGRTAEVKNTVYVRDTGKIIVYAVLSGGEYAGYFRPCDLELIPTSADSQQPPPL